jgi:murein DD-endopeptidase MepM/ murein hydrolase activator NlpD
MRSPYDDSPIRLRDVFGLDPLGKALRDARLALAGNDYSPGVEWGLSSTKIFKPHISIPTWLGRRRDDRRLPIYNFFNRNLPDPRAAYSVKVERCRDFLGGQWTYDSHFGTDFACPVGTPIVAPAPGVVLRDLVEIDHGGLKLCLDHGEGLFTTHGHLSRSYVRVGQRVERGEVIGLSGASGLEFMLFWPWVAPHLHLNVWLNAQPIDPFAVPGSGEVSMWRAGNEPLPHDGESVPEDQNWKPSSWNADGLEANIAAIRDPEIVERIRGYSSLEEQAAEILVMRVFRGAMFAEFPPIYAETSMRRPTLDLPFRRVDTPGVAFPEGYAERLRR